MVKPLSDPCPRAAAAGAGVLLLTLLLVAPLPGIEPSLRMSALQDALHVPCFVILPLLLHRVLRASGIGAGRLGPLPAIGLAGVMAALTEVAQAFTSRTPGMGDFLLDLTGIATGAAILFAGQAQDSRPRVLRFLWVAATGAVALVAGTRPVLEAMQAERLQRQMLPVLGDFEDDREMRFWSPQSADPGHPSEAEAVRKHATRGGRSLELRTSGGAWSGVRLRLESPALWEPAQSLCLDLHSDAAETFELGVRVDTPDGRRFTAAIPVLPGMNHCRLRPADLVAKGTSLSSTGGIRFRTLVLHLGESSVPRKLHFDHIRLE